MIIYNLVLIITVLSGIPLCKMKHGRMIYCIVSGLILFAVAAVRRSVGYDYNIYGTNYICSVPLSLDELSANSYMRMEIGYLLLTKLLADYFVDYHILFVVTAAIITFPLMAYIYKYCEKPYLAVFGFLTLGLYFNTLDFMRQMIAALLISFGLRYIEKKHFFRFLIIAVFASCIHISVLIMIPFYFILKIKMNTAVLSVYTVISVLIYIFSHDIMLYITNHIYPQYNPDSSIHMTTGLFPIYTIYFGVIFIAAFILRKQLTEKNSFNSIIINCMFFSVLFELIGTKHAVISRLALYFLVPASLELIPAIYNVLLEMCQKKFKNDKHKLTIAKTVAVISVTMLCTGMFEYMIVKGYNGVTPYQTIFDENVRK